jgi:hypothetical protein
LRRNAARYARRIPHQSVDGTTFQSLSQEIAMFMTFETINVRTEGAVLFAEIAAPP